jgi:hypothetical protein
MEHDKNAQLIATAKAAKETGVEKLIAVCPIEYDMYYTEDLQDPIAVRTEAEQEAFKIFPEMVLLRPNLSYGNYAYLIRYMEQSVVAGKIPKELGDETDHTKYSPVHYEDIFNTVKAVHKDYSSHKGRTYHVNGKEELTLNEITTLIETAVGNKAKRTNNLGLIDFAFHFFSGCSHDRNMRELANYYRENSWDFKENDFFAEHGVTGTQRIGSSFFDARHDMKRFVHPTFQAYKSVSID